MKVQAHLMAASFDELLGAGERVPERPHVRQRRCKHGFIIPERPRDERWCQVPGCPASALGRRREQGCEAGDGAARGGPPERGG